MYLESPSPTVSPTSCPEQKCKLCPWALIVIIVLGILFIFAVALELWWRLRCCCEDENGCWDSHFWTCVFCVCFRKGNLNHFVHIKINVHVLNIH